MTCLQIKRNDPEKPAPVVPARPEDAVSLT